MASKLKITVISLATVFVAAGASVEALLYEADLESKKLRAEIRKSIARTRPHDSLVGTPEENLINDAYMNAFQNCLEKKAIPVIGIARAAENWGQRLSLLPGISYQLHRVANEANRRGYQEEISCLKKFWFMTEPAPMV